MYLQGLYEDATVCMPLHAYDGQKYHNQRQKNDVSMVVLNSTSTSTVSALHKKQCAPNSAADTFGCCAAATTNFLTVAVPLLQQTQPVAVQRSRADT